MSWDGVVAIGGGILMFGFVIWALRGDPKPKAPSADNDWKREPSSRNRDALRDDSLPPETVGIGIGGNN